MAEKTSIRISKTLKRELDSYKQDNSDTYEGVIWDLVENHKELNEKTLKEIEKSRKEFREGKFITHEKLKKKLRL